MSGPTLEELTRILRTPDGKGEVRKAIAIDHLIAYGRSTLADELREDVAGLISPEECLNVTFHLSSQMESDRMAATAKMQRHNTALTRLKQKVGVA